MTPAEHIEAWYITQERRRMSKRLKGHWVPIEGEAVCDDCGKTCRPFRWNVNGKAKLRRLCVPCYEDRLIVDQERRYGLKNWAAESTKSS